MQAGSSVRYLSALGGASTSRVLNLAAVAETKSNDPEYSADPLFQSPITNTSILIKHRVRPHEEYLFHDPVSVATKIIVPYDRHDLRLGGRSFFVDQKGFVEALKDVGRYGERGIERDVQVLRLINHVPSLDPFLLREYLKLHNINVPNCYLEISAADRDRMCAFATKNMRPFIQLASGNGEGQSDAQTGRFVSALLADDSGEKLEPLRTVLMLDGEEFREGVFSWRGFLYYKWSLHSFLPDVGAILKSIQEVTPRGTPSPDDGEYIVGARKRIADAVRVAAAEVGRILGVYDKAYASLLERGQPRAFRDFLLSAPHMFVDLGEKMGAISHIATFWRFRFLRKGAPSPGAEELVAILQDFESGFPPPPVRAMAAVK